ncbi:MAG: hypothetical protein ACP5I7_05225 [Sulfolobales archaeon]
MKQIINTIYKKYVTIVSLVILAIVAVSVVSPGALSVALAQQNTATTPMSSMPCNNTFVKAQVLYNILNMSLSLNLSKETVSEIKDLLAVNISRLSCSELENWVKNASKTLSSIENMVREGRAYAIGLAEQRYLNGLKNALENRLREIGKEYNISVEELVASITSAKDINEIMRELKKTEMVVESVRAKKFVDVIIKVGVEDAYKSAKDLEKSLKDLEITSRLINETIEKLSKYNISPNLVALLKEAQAKISEAKMFLENISKVVKIEGENKLREVFNKTSQKYYEEVLEELEEIRQELLELKQQIASLNETNITALIDELLSKIDAMYNQIKNASVDDISRWIPDLLEIKAKIKYLKEILEEALEKSVIIKRMPPASYQLLLNKTKELLSEVVNMTKYINSTYSQLCLNVTTNDSVMYHHCMMLREVVPGLLNLANNSIESAKKLISESEELYNANKTFEALIKLSQARAILELTKAKLEPVYEILKKVSEEKEKEKTKTTTPKIKVSIEGELRILKNTTKLVLKIKNEGSTTATINKVIIAITPAVAIELNMSINPGEEKIIEKDLLLTPTQINLIKSRSSVPAIVIVNNEVSITIYLEVVK